MAKLACVHAILRSLHMPSPRISHPVAGRTMSTPATRALVCSLTVAHRATAFVMDEPTRITFLNLASSATARTSLAMRFHRIDANASSTPSAFHPRSDSPCPRTSMLTTGTSPGTDLYQNSGCFSLAPPNAPDMATTPRSCQWSPPMTCFGHLGMRSSCFFLASSARSATWSTTNRPRWTGNHATFSCGAAGWFTSGSPRHSGAWCASAGTSRYPLPSRGYSTVDIDPPCASKTTVPSVKNALLATIATRNHRLRTMSPTHPRTGRVISPAPGRSADRSSAVAGDPIVCIGDAIAPDGSPMGPSRAPASACSARRCYA